MTQKNLRASVVAVCGAALLTTMGCSTSRAFLNYNEFASEMALKTGPVGGQNVGAVHGDEGGAIWDNCTNRARDSVKEMIAQAREKGANAIGDIKWHATESSDPACKKSWGFVAIWPFLLTPLFMSTAVDGNAYKTSGAKTGLLMIPKSPSDDESLVNQIMALK